MTPAPPERGRRAGAERGSVLLLFPAAVLVMIVLAAIAVDSAIAFLAQRQVGNAVAAAANDASGLAVGNRAFYAGGSVDIDPATAVGQAEERVRAALDGGRFHDLAVVAEVVPAAAGCPPRVRVRASARVDVLFAKAIPGAAEEAEVRAVSTGSPRQTPGAAC